MEYLQALHIFIVGVAVLIGAIAINVLASYLGLSTWYVFLETIGKEGMVKAFSRAGIISLVFMFLIYPLMLGAIGYYLTRLLL